MQFVTCRKSYCTLVKMGHRTFRDKFIEASSCLCYLGYTNLDLLLTPIFHHSTINILFIKGCVDCFSHLNRC